MRHGQTIDEQILSGIFVSAWLLSRPFVWAYIMVRWFIVAVFYETGRRLVKITAVAIVAVIVGMISTHI